MFPIDTGVPLDDYVLVMDRHTTPDDLRRWIERAGWTHQQVADYLGCSRALVSHFVNGTRSPSLRLAVRIQRMAGIKATSWVIVSRKAIPA